jgi:hypothetical protein
MPERPTEEEASRLLGDAQRALDRATPSDVDDLRSIVGPVVRSMTRLWSRLNPTFDSEAWYPISWLLTEHWPEIVAFQSQVTDADWHNPWPDLEPQDGQIVHPADAPFVAAFNAVSVRADETLVTSAWPEPWAGPAADASVLVLGANPGWAGEADAAAQEQLSDLARANLSGHEPLVWLREAARATPAALWYRQQLLKDVLGVKGGIDETTVAQSLAVVDFHAYHAVKWRALPVTLPTQQHTFDLVRQRLAADASIVLTRCAFEWCIAIPELRNHPNVCRTKSTQTTRLSPNNLGAEPWSALLDRLR